MRAVRSVIRRKSIWAVIIWTGFVLTGFVPAMSESPSVQGQPSVAALAELVVAVIWLIGLGSSSS
jgi:hypothetical protein